MSTELSKEVKERILKEIFLELYSELPEEEHQYMLSEFNLSPEVVEVLIKICDLYLFKTTTETLTNGENLTFNQN